MRLNLARATALALATTLLAACGSDPAPTSAPTSSLRVQDAWVRATTGSDDTTMTGAFMTISNDGDQDVVLESAASPVAGMVQLHEMAMVDGAMVMQEVQGGITVEAGQTKSLEPGGYHVMLMNLDGELMPGSEVALTLVFSDGTSLELTAPVKTFTEEEGHYHEPDGSEPSTMPATPSPGDAEGMSP